MQKHRLFSCKVLPTLNASVNISRIEFHTPCHSSVLLASHNCRSASVKQVEDYISALCIVLNLVIKQSNRLHCRMYICLCRSLIINNRCLLSITRPQVTCAFFPTIQTRLVFPLIILSTHYHTVFIPDKALSYFPTDIKARTTEIIAFRISVPNIENSTLFHYGIRRTESISQKLSETIVIHAIVLNSKAVFCFAFISHIIRWGL